MYLTLLIDAPLQSWGSASRFQRRTSGLSPTKSGIIGMICAAMGLAKGSGEEASMLPQLAALKMTSIRIPRCLKKPWSENKVRLPLRRMDDYHTVGGGYDKGTQWQNIPRQASGGPDKDATITHREYLLDAQFGVILEGEEPLLARVALALQNPVWGMWFGRKSCIPADNIFRGLFESRSEAVRALVGEDRLEEYLVVEEVNEISQSTYVVGDQPVSFGDNTSSGPDKRLFAARYVAIRKESNN